MFNNSKEKVISSMFENLITQSKPQIKETVTAMVNDHGIMNEHDLHDLYDSMYGSYYNSIDAIMKGAGSNIYAKFKLTMAMPQDALDGLFDDLLDSPFSYLPVWALYAVVCYSYTGKQPSIDKMQFISKHFFKTIQASIQELEDEL